MKKFKSLASTHIRKIAILLVISTLSSTILCSCGDDKNSTQIEEETEETTTQKPDEAKDEKTERQNQDADPTEATTTQQSNDTKPSTQPTNQSTESTTQAHVHNFKTETYYTTETQTVHHDAVTHTVHHDAVTHQETTYTTETQTVERSGYICDDGAFFENEIEAGNYCLEHFLGYCSGTKKETVEVQVPHTETVVDQAAYDETVTDKPAWNEEVEVQVAHTRNVCSCGATK